MVEKVARALGRHADSVGMEPNPEHWTHFARVAIEAMREPTKEMVLAGDDEKEACIDSDWDSDVDGNRHDYTIINSDLPARVWRAMLDAALALPIPGGENTEGEKR